VSDDDNDEPVVREGARISHEEAVLAARSAVRDHLTLSEGADVRIEEEDDRIVVEFGSPTPPGQRGPDYEARVTVNAQTGEVIDILGGS
jgi:uncharacterized membrane protein YkoI